MAIAVLPVADEPVDPPRVVELRQRLASLVHERDRLVDRTEESERALAQLRVLHKHSLSIRCDRRGCGAAIAVSSSHAPNDGELARGLFVYARAMQWLVGCATKEALAALGAGTDVGISGSDFVVSDVCPMCRAQLAAQ